ncbi:hypothetical protein [Romboutsia sp. MSSM.1001216sp_RTP31141st1_G3_RTP31141_220114]|uniref:hypothetical protein n=1 Tax=unclassified Romboutsia TaxID=2626894 RepID=UPI0031B58033
MKNELRKVKCRHRTMGFVHEGYLHSFAGTDSEVYAIVEDEDGEICKFPLSRYSIRFLDRDSIR